MCSTAVTMAGASTRPLFSKREPPCTKPRYQRRKFSAMSGSAGAVGSTAVGPGSASVQGDHLVSPPLPGPAGCSATCEPSSKDGLGAHLCGSSLGEFALETNVLTSSSL